VLEFMSRHHVPGGTIIVDDYGHFSAGAQRAVDEFVASNEGFRLTLPPEWARKFAILQRAQAVG
jgi:hypothetical protein